MPMTLTQIEFEVQKLPLNERATLAEHIVSDFDSEHERKWLNEIDKRYSEYLAGRMKSRPAEDVFKDAFEKLKSAG